MLRVGEEEALGWAVGWSEKIAVVVSLCSAQREEVGEALGATPVPLAQAVAL